MSDCLSVLYLCLYFSLFVWFLFVWLSWFVDLFVCLFFLLIWVFFLVCLFLCFPVCLFICLSVFLFVCLSVCLFILFVWLVSCLFFFFHIIFILSLNLFFQGIIHEVVFPLMCHTDEDQELWDEDPYDFIRVKYGNLSLLFCCLSAAGTFENENYNSI